MITLRDQYSIGETDLVAVAVDFTPYLASGEYLSTASVSADNLTISSVGIIQASYVDAHRTDFDTQSDLVVASGKAVTFYASGNETGQQSFTVTVTTDDGQTISRKGYLHVV